MKGFVTGSRAYGTPRPDSDLDVVALVEDVELIRALAALADKPESVKPEGHSGHEHGLSLRFGKLNLILLETEQEFAAWQRATEKLKASKPVARAAAVEAIEAELALAEKGGAA